ncbi:hypothetical protein EHS39_02585 [Ensifer sp. MPMI2T]|nr:hypothetical protein EHS39_02585 [Ensifer sp. MPMI2T]
MKFLRVKSLSPASGLANRQGKKKHLPRNNPALANDPERGPAEIMLGPPVANAWPRTAFTPFRTNKKKL